MSDEQKPDEGTVKVNLDRICPDPLCQCEDAGAPWVRVFWGTQLNPVEDSFRLRRISNEVTFDEYLSHRKAGLAPETSILSFLIDPLWVALACKVYCQRLSSRELRRLNLAGEEPGDLRAGQFERMIVAAMNSTLPATLEITKPSVDRMRTDTTYAQRVIGHALGIVMSENQLPVPSSIDSIPPGATLH